MIPVIPAVAVLLVAGLAAGCAQPAPRSRATAAATAACRVEVDRVYSAQNRVDLSRSDQRDSPFAGSYLPGVTTRGLSAEYGRDNMVQSCLNANAPTGAGVAPTSTAPGPTFSPVSR